MNQRFEEEGTAEWLCAKTGAPTLYPPGLAYSVKLSRRNVLKVRIVGKYGRVLVTAKAVLNDDDDWRDQIGKLAERAYDRLDWLNAKSEARHGENAYFGTFRFGGNR